MSVCQESKRPESSRTSDRNPSTDRRESFRQTGQASRTDAVLGLIPRKSASVECAIHLSESQVRAVEEFRRRHRTGVLTLLFTDVEGSAALKNRLGEQPASQLLSRHNEIIRKALVNYPEAQEISTAGDSFFLVFARPSDSVRFALLAQLRLRELEESEKRDFRVNIGIHMGEVMIEEDDDGGRTHDVLGMQVDIAARVNALARGGQVLMTRGVFDNARQVLKGELLPGITNLSWMSHGQYLLKGFEEPVAICEVGERGVAPLERPADCEAAKQATVPGAEPVLGWRPAVEQLVPGTEWELERKLGEGGFGEVWVARHRRTKEQRVFKFCFRADRLRNLKREMTLFRLLKEELGSREDIVRLIEVQFDDIPYYLAFEYTSGGDLADWVEARGGFETVPPETRLEIVAQIAGALAAAHSAGVIHKDIKPSNVLLDEQKDGAIQIRLTDFGIGQLTDREILARAGVTATGFTETISGPSETSSRSGTRIYMAPELLEGRPPTDSADVYALGVLLYQLACGDLSRVLATGWERDIEDDLLREDIGLCVDHSPEHRFPDAGELAERLRALPKRRAEREKAHRRKRRNLWFAAVAGGVAIIGIGFLLLWVNQRGVKARWAKDDAIPEITRLIDGGEYLEAYSLALTAEPYVPEDLWGRMTRRISCVTTPTGAAVSYRDWSTTDSEWTPVGRSPFVNARFPRGTHRWKFESRGYETLEIVSDVDDLQITLPKVGERYSGMVRIAPTTASVHLGLLQHAPRVSVPAFWMDKFEVTNRAFKQFVDSSGYEKPQYWNSEFVKDGQVLSWEQAVSEFIDSTGRPGPSTWKDGAYPEGQADFPVCGVSWYEAAAYAQFRGKSLPTVYHWSSAARVYEAAVLVPLSNFGDRGPAPVGNHPGIGSNGLYDMAGNVKEWCWNASSETYERRYILGGAWGEPTYLFTLADAQSPWDRRRVNGFRCVKYPGGEESFPMPLRGPIALRYGPDYSKMTPVGDDEFESIKRFYAYDKTDLHDRMEQPAEDFPYWRRQKVSFATAYGGERMSAYLYLPKNARPPYQTVVYFSGTSSQRMTTFPTVYDPPLIEFIIMSGRALMYPVYKGTYERKMDGWVVETESEPVAHREYMVQVVKDLQRSLDYLETREDIDSGKIAFYGFSWGGWMAPIILAVENRFKAGLVVAGGYPGFALLPEVDPPNFTPRVTVPVLMVNGKDDARFPIETLQKPMFESLGTPPEDKSHVTYPGGHGLWGLFGAQIRKDLLDWLDRYLGPVNRGSG